MSNSVAIQMCPFSDHLENELVRRLSLIRWFDLSSNEKEEFLNSQAASVDAIVTGGHIGCENSLIDRLPNLGIIAINGVGFDKVDLDHARAREIAVTVTQGALSEDVADLAIGLVIALLRQIPQANAYTRRGDWQSGEISLANKVSGRQFGIIGLGNIGSEIAKRLEAFGAISYTDMQEVACGYTYCSNLLELAKSVDVLIVACAAIPATHKIVNAEVLKALGAKGYLINVARGSIVDEAALVSAISSGTIAGAALDVFEDEPNIPEGLLKDDRVLLTPHIASGTHETRLRMAELVLENLDAFLNSDTPPNSLT